MITLKKIALLFSIILFFSPLGTVGQSKYVKKYKHTADSLSKVYGVPAALFLGIAIIESGAGKSRNAKLLNNHFGIIGKNNMHKLKGKRRRSNYKQYANATLSYIDFANHLTRRKFYNRLKGKMNYILWVDAMSKDNYSEVPKIWKQRVISTIKKHKLSRL